MPVALAALHGSIGARMGAEVVFVQVLTLFKYNCRETMTRKMIKQQKGKATPCPTTIA
jgi:hypothetical protein